MGLLVASSYQDFFFSEKKETEEVMRAQVFF